MSAPDPEGMSILAKGLAAGTPIVAAVWGFFKLYNKKADKHAVASQFKAVTSELAHQRATQAKIFDKLAEAESKNEERHRTLLMHLLERTK